MFPTELLCYDVRREHSDFKDFFKSLKLEQFSKFHRKFLPLRSYWQKFP